MRSVEVSLAGRAYPVMIGAGLLAREDLWSRFLTGGRCLVVTNEVVAPLYLDRVRVALGPDRCEALVLPDGEAEKTLASWSRVLDRLVAMKAGRDASLVALGGGVVGDIAGFAAACYMRGIAFVQAPTTLLAQVDASVGGKTAVNHARGKNLIGAFHQPRAVLADTTSLDTLPEREYLAGVAEVVKYGAIRDAAFFDWLAEKRDRILGRDHDMLAELIERCVRNKAEVVAEDEFEAGVRALLNFGHSFGHALESLTAYAHYLHGEAVAIGMAVAATLSEQRGLCPTGTAGRLRGLLADLRLPVRVPKETPTDAIIDRLALDKKVLGGQTRLILLEEIGCARVDDASSTQEIGAAIEACR